MYSILDNEGNFKGHRETCPENGNYTDVVYNGNFVKPKFDSVNNVFFESATAEEIENYKSTLLKDIKEDCRKKLAKTDWYVTRLSERQIPIPQSVKDERQAILDECERLESEITE